MQGISYFIVTVAGVTESERGRERANARRGLFIFLARTSKFIGWLRIKESIKKALIELAHQFYSVYSARTHKRARPTPLSPARSCSQPVWRDFSVGNTHGHVT